MNSPNSTMNLHVEISANEPPAKPSKYISGQRTAEAAAVAAAAGDDGGVVDAATWRKQTAVALHT